MNQKDIFFCLMCLTITGFTFGQKDYKSGYIITNEFDTIYGFVNLKSNFLNSRSCEFRENGTIGSKTYSPQDIHSYRIENSKYYISKEITLNNETKRIFLEYLVDGIVDLYYLKEAREDIYFIEKEGILHQLSNEEKEVIVNNVTYLKNSNQYIGILNDLFRESPETINEIKNTSFSYKSLINITKDYHNYVCKDQTCIDYTKSAKKNIWVELNTGSGFSWMGLKTSGDYSYNVRPFGGVNIRFIPFRSHYVWNFTTGVNISANDFVGDFKNDLFIYELTYHISTKYTMIHIPFKVEYSFPADKLQPFVALSYNNIILINSNYQIYEKYPYGTIPVNSALRKYQLGLSFDLGMRFYLNKNSYIYIKNEIEFRKSAQNYRHALDYHRVFSEMISFGYGFRII